VLPGSDFGSRAPRTRTRVASAGARSPSAEDAAVAAALAVLEIVLPRPSSATRRSANAVIS